MNQTLPLQVRELTVGVYQAVVQKWNPGFSRSNDFKRDCRFLRDCPDRRLLMDLPGYGKILDRLLAKGEEDQFSFQLPLDGCTDPLPPRLFQALVEGVHRLEPLAVMALRQILHLFSKLEWSTPPGDVFDAFKERVLSLPSELSIVKETAASTIWYYVMHDLDWSDIIPRHGPGVVATRERPWEKMRFKRIYASVQAKYPADEYFFLNSSHLCDRLDDLLQMQEIPEPHTRLCAVPKDFRGPRLISAEPLETQWLQQGQARAMMERIEKHPLTRGYVNFTSQDVNRQLALRSSTSREFATIDLKDASDRVSMALAKSIMDKDSFEFLSATRSTKTQLPDGSLVPLRMFSPMGSAVCFPIESLVFYSLVLGAIHRNVYPGKPATFNRLRGLLGNVYVYGDDIIVRTQYVDLAISVLTLAGLKVNDSKCCTGPRFRESCGMDAYSGLDVTPVRIKHLPYRRNPVTLASSCDYINRFNELGMQTVAQSLEDWVVSEFGVALPRAPRQAPLSVFDRDAIRCHIYNQSHFKSRRNPHLQLTEYYVPQLEYRYMRSTLPHWCEAFRSILMNTHANTLGYAVPHRVRLTTRWVSY